MRSHDWTGFAALGAFILAILVMARGSFGWAAACLAAGLALAVLTRHWSRKYRAPMPHLLRWTLLVPRGNHSPPHLLELLEPRPGERLLEIGPGVGVHSVPVASAVGPAGVLDVVDVQPAMLADVVQRAKGAGVGNIRPHLADARCLPFRDASFDAAYLVGVLGEVADEMAALRELRRVVKPSGRIVVGEVAFDPDFVPFASLQSLAAAAGFAFERRIGSSLSFLARFRPIPRS